MRRVEAILQYLEPRAPKGALTSRQAALWDRCLRGAWETFLVAADRMPPGDALEALRARLFALENHPLQISKDPRATARPRLKEA